MDDGTADGTQAPVFTLSLYTFFGLYETIHHHTAAGL